MTEPTPITDRQLSACEKEWQGDWEDDDGMYDFERSCVARIRADAEKLRVAEELLLELMPAGFEWVVCQDSWRSRAREALAKIKSYK